VTDFGIAESVAAANYRAQVDEEICGGPEMAPGRCIVGGQIYNSAVEGQTFEERLAEVVDFMEGLGFLSRWEKTDEGFVITNINCPYRIVTRSHDEVCIMDTEILSSLLGVVPQRMSSMHQGESSCSFLLVPPES